MIPFWSLTQNRGHKDLIRAYIEDDSGYQRLHRIIIAPNTTENVYRGQVGIGNTAPTYKLELANNSRVYRGYGRAYSWSTFSDGRLKTNREPLDYGLDEILKLKPLRYFHHNSGHTDQGLLDIYEDGETTIGLIAQDVFAIIPEAATPPEDEATDLWGMDYNRLVPVLIKAIQEQQAQIEAQQAEIDRLKALEARLNAMERAIQE